MSPKKILFACVPADGHFNPLTGLAVYLKSLGHDVRWYTQDLYREKIMGMGIRHYPFVRAPQLNHLNFETSYRRRVKIHNRIGRLKFDIENGFILRTIEYFEDIREIRRSFPFDLMIADCMFTGIPLVKEKLQVPVISVGIAPLMATSKQLPPPGMGMHPAANFAARLMHAWMRWTTEKIIFRRHNALYRSILKDYGLTPPPTGNFVDIILSMSSLVFQSGTPGFEYPRSDLSENVRYIGPLLPYTPYRRHFSINRHMRYDKIVLVTQGTIEKDPAKLVVPVLEAYRNTNTLVIATTGGSGTAQLKAAYPDDNFIIEDFISFTDIMPVCDVFITNGGYGGVLLGIQHQLPMVVAGVHEGKNEIAARVSYFGLGINLRTEKPAPAQIRKAVVALGKDSSYKNNVRQLAAAFSQYDTLPLCAAYIAEIFAEGAHTDSDVTNNSTNFLREEVP